ncbi:MAG: hypothetical protein ACOCP4_03910 [Candidatus Woesearchaeota archaeon]
MECNNGKYETKRPTDADSLIELLDITGLDEKVDTEYAESIQNELDIVFNEGEKRDEESRKMYDRIVKGNPSGAAFLKNRFDDVSFETEGSDSIERAINMYLDIGDKISDPFSYGSAARIIEEYGVKEGFYDEYVESIEGAVKTFFERDLAPLNIVDVLYETGTEEDIFREFEQVYSKIMKVADDEDSIELYGAVYKLVEDLESSDEKFSDGIEDKLDLKELKKKSYEKMEDYLSESNEKDKEILWMKEYLSLDFLHEDSRFLDSRYVSFEPVS